MARCEVCFRRCEIAEGRTGFCGARGVRDGVVKAVNYGKITSLALDPIEKKPLSRFFPGSRILSVGSYGCNLRCPFCQNYEISWSDAAWRYERRAKSMLPEELVDLAAGLRSSGNIGIAFTYNEPLIGYEFVLDTARLAKERGLKNVLVTNGTAQLSVLEKLGPYIDAMNIDLKGFTDRYYTQVIHGSRQMVMEFITRAVKLCHVELTTLIVPGENDSVEEMSALSRWVARLEDGQGNVIGNKVPLHVTRFFPRFHMTDRDATDIGRIRLLTETAKENLAYVFPGNC